MPSKKIRFIILGLILLSLSGCTRFYYNYADWMISWHVGGYIDFTRSQQRVFDNFVDEQLAWHRKQELPRYSTYLESLYNELQQPMTPQQVELRFDESLDFWQAIFIKAMPEMNRIFLQLSNQQVEEFLANLSTEQKELEYDHKKSSAEKNIQIRSKNMEKGLKRFIGKLNNEQRKQINQWSRDTSGIFASSIEQRKNWQQQINLTFREHRGDPQLFSKEATQLFVYPDHYWDDAYTQRIEKNRQITFILFSDIQQSLTAKQHKKLNKTLKGYLKDLRILHQG